MVKENMKNEIKGKVKQLRDSKILCLSSNKYYLNVVDSDEVTYRIDSEELIIYFAPFGL